jgi:radical SAM superfamily enzyme YgiQ (UPF0313 family)
VSHQIDFQTDALLVGYENQENIGLRSITAFLTAEGYRVELVPFSPHHNELVLEAIRKHKPRLVGFSLIFQYALDEFGVLITYLRAQGVAVHFTAGGHFPSLRPKETLHLLAGLDSVVRFEGEVTLARLLVCLDEPDDWIHIAGLVFRKGDNVHINPCRPLISDLDSLPPIFRDEQPRTASGVNMATMLASRGCLHNCSFCSVRQFYGSAKGSLRRIRSPESVADEMLALYSQKDIRFFSFQDDDFAARTAQQRKWVFAFLQAMAQAGLSDKVRWKISCRVDDLDAEILEAMIDHGLMGVYLGVESGSETGLRTLGKHVTVAQNLTAIELVKTHQLALAIGFMLFDPSSTFKTIQENICFLKEVGKDGYFSINFCKMLPYAGTPIEEELRNTERLRGTVTTPEYSLLDSDLDGYEYVVSRIFNKRNFSSNGIVARLQEADFNMRLASAFNPQPENGYEKKLRELTSRSNLSAIDALESLLREMTSKSTDFLVNEQNILLNIAEQEWKSEMQIEVELDLLALQRAG